MQNTTIKFPMTAITGREDIIFVNETTYLRNGKLVEAKVVGAQVERPRAIPGIAGIVTATESKLMAKTTDGLIISYNGIESTLTNTDSTAEAAFPHILAQTKDGNTLVVEIDPGIKETFKLQDGAVAPGLFEKGKALVMVIEKDGSFKTFRTSPVSEVLEGAPTGKRLLRLVSTFVGDMTGLNPSLVAFNLVPFTADPVAEPVPGAAVTITFPAKFAPVFDFTSAALADLLGKIGLEITTQDSDENDVKYIVTPSI